VFGSGGRWQSHHAALSSHVTRESIEAHDLEAAHNLQAHDLEVAEGLALERAAGAERHVHIPHPAFAFQG